MWNGNAAVTIGLFLLCSVSLDTAADIDDGGRLPKANTRDKRPTPVLDDFCAKRTDGQIYPHPADCRSYVFCSSAIGYVSTCANGLYYNRAVQTCDFDTGICKGQGHTNDVSQSFGQPFTTRQSRDGNRLPGMGASGDPLTPGLITPTLRQSDPSPPRPPSPDVNKPPDAFRKEQERVEMLKSDESLRDLCHGRPDDTYGHPTDCHSYVYCSNGGAFPATCPDDLIFNQQLGGCDFDIEGLCGVSAGPRAKPPRPPYHDTVEVSPPAMATQDLTRATSEMPRQLSMMMPEAIERAMTALMESLQHEADIALHQTDFYNPYLKEGKPRIDRPFKLVQRFLKAKPLAKQLAMPAFVLNSASKELLDELGPEADPRLAAMLRTRESPLPSSSHRLQADEPLPQPEPGSCPWPMYSCAVEKYRSFDGSCNNLHYPLRGRSFTPFRRFLPPNYADGMNTLRRAVGGGPLPPARRISYTVVEDRDLPNHIHTVLLMQWGQFVDHDLTLTAISKLVTDPSGYGLTADIECGKDGCASEPEACEPITIEPGDPNFTDRKCLEFVRSQQVPNLNCTMGPREQLNQITSYQDASSVYGSSREDADRLRDFSNTRRGRMKWTEHPGSARLKPLLPQTTEDKECKDFDKDHQCFKGGDERVNEQNALTVMHTIWLREHNRIEGLLHQVNPHWEGDTLYQETRRIIGAMMQHITYNEYLPTVLGPLQIQMHELKLLQQGHYKGYDVTVDASIANVFATAAYRFGHTLIPPEFHRANHSFHTEAYHALPLSELFFRPRNVYNTADGGVDGFVRGLCSQRIQTYDRFVTKQVTAHLFSESPPGGLGTDLVSLNIQRGRDHGIPGYNDWREWCGMKRAKTFDELQEIVDPAIREKFKQLYNHVDDIDLFPAGIAEQPVEAGLLGPTFACIIGRQFHNLRKGDRFWYENDGGSRFTEDQLSELRKLTLAKVLCNNGDDIDSIQPRAMELPLRQAYPNKEYQRFPEKLGLNIKWFTRLWDSDYNARVNCSFLPDIDITKWRD